MSDDQALSKAEPAPIGDADVEPRPETVTPSTSQPSPAVEALTAQLTQLNERSRWYSNQQWQIPFAYFTMVGVTLAIATNKDTSTGALVTVLFFGGVLGFFLVWHFWSLWDGVERAVKEINRMEKTLRLPPTAQFRRSYTTPLFVTLIASSGLLLLAAAGRLVGWF